MIWAPVQTIRRIAEERRALPGFGVVTTCAVLGFVPFAPGAVLVVIGAARARRIGHGESAGSCAISCAGCLGLIIVAGVILAVAIPVILSAAGGAQ